MFCCMLLYVHSSIAIILMGKRELVALLNLSSWCLVMIERLFLAVPWGCLGFVIVVFPDHTHLLFLNINSITTSLNIRHFWLNKTTFKRLKITHYLFIICSSNSVWAISICLRVITSLNVASCILLEISLTENWKTMICLPFICKHRET